MRTVPFLLLLASPSTADVLDVRGPTPDHTQIADAVAAAQEGDVIRVWPGNYQVFTVDRSLSIVRATFQGTVKVQGTIRVRDLAPGQRVELTGIEAAGSDGSALIVSSCAGSVRVREGVFAGADHQLYSAHPGVRVLDSDDVELVFCNARGGLPPWGEIGGWGAAGLTASDSRVSLYASSFTGSPGSTDDDPGASGYSGGDGIFASGEGILYVSGCTLIGGDGGNADIDPDLWTGEYGYGGDGGWGHRGNMPAWFLDCTFEPGEGGWSPDSSHHGSDGQPTMGGTHLPGGARILRTNGLLDDLTDLSVRCEGEPGDDVWMATRPGPGYRFHSLRGPLLIETPPPSAQWPWIFLGTIDASGVLLVDLPARDLPPLTHATPHFQATFMNGASYFGSSSWTVVLDAAW